MTKTIDYLFDVRIEWTMTMDGPFSYAEGKYKDWKFSVSRNPRGGWNIQINSIQAWTYMGTFDEAMGSVRTRLRDWAYMDQFRG